MNEQDSVSSKPAVPGEPGNRHVVRVFTLLGVVLVLAVVARQLLVPATYGQFGPYRGAAVQQLMDNPTPVHQRGSMRRMP